MVLKKYKTLEDARQAMVADDIARSIGGKPRRISENDAGRQHIYAPGLYRFRSWGEAREDDLQRMIRASRKGR